MNRLLRNLRALPRRTLASVARRLQPAHRYQRAADRHVRRALPAARVAQILAVPGTSSAREGRLLYYLAATTPAPGCLVEIGAYRGRSTAWLAEAARRTGRRLVSIDPHLHDSYADFRQTVTTFAIEEVATLHRAYSHEIGATWNQPIAFLWIDGGHDYDTVLQDIRDFAPHVQPGGFVVFDDADGEHFPGVTRAIAEALVPDRCFEDLGRLKAFALFRRRV